MIQGVWAAGAADGQIRTQNPRTLTEMALLQVMLPILTRLSDALAQDPNAATNLQDANNLEAIMIMYDNNSERMVKDLYVAWLNADVTRAIVVKQNAVQACHQMGIEKVPELWAQLIVDVSDVLRANGIESLDRRSNSISWLVYTDQMPAVVNRSLDLSNRNLTVCDAWNIPNAGTLRELYLHINQLTTLPVGVFNGLGALEYLSLDNNQLTALPVGVFNGLGALRKLNLHNNQLTTIADGTFAGLGALRELHLNGNQLTTLTPGTFIGLGALAALWLNNNQLTTLAPGTFAGLGSLTTLWLHSNRLTTLAPGTFAGLDALITLYLHNNQLTALPVGVFNGLVALGSLYLHNNQLTALPYGAFAGLGDLTTLSLSHNPKLQLQLQNPNNLEAIQIQHPEWFKKSDLLPAISGEDYLREQNPGFFIKNKPAKFFKRPWEAEAACAIQ